MRMILSSRDEKLLSLIELIEREKFQTFNQIEKALEINPRTLNSLIKYGNEIFSPGEIYRSKEGIILIHSSETITVKYYYQKILENSLEFNIIESVFFDQYTISKLANKLFISESTLRRLIDKLNVELTKIEMKIDTKIVALNGNEKNICNLIINLLLEKYSDCTFLFDGYRVSFVESIIKKVFKQRNIGLNYPDFYRVKVWLLVVFHRANQTRRQTHGVRLRDSILVKLLSIEALKRTLYFPLKNNPYINALDFLFSEQMIFEYEELEKKIKYDPLLKEKKERFDRIIHYIEEYFNIVITDHREKLLVDLCNAASIHFGPPFILYDKYKMFSEEVMKYNKTFFIEIKKVFMSQFPNEPAYVIDTYLYMIITHWPQLLLSLNKTISPIRLSLVFDSDIEHMEMIENLIGILFPRRFMIKIVSHFTSLKELKNIIDTQLVVTNICDLNLPRKDIIVTSLYPSENELEKLRDYYENDAD